jgi:transposase
MQVLYERYAGIAIHKKMIVVTVLITLFSSQVQKFTRTFSTMTADLLALADWLDGLHVVHIQPGPAASRHQAADSGAESWVSAAKS